MRLYTEDHFPDLALLADNTSDQCSLQLHTKTHFHYNWCNIFLYLLEM